MSNIQSIVLINHLAGTVTVDGIIRDLSREMKPSSMRTTKWNGQDAGQYVTNSSHIPVQFTVDKWAELVQPYVELFNSWTAPDETKFPVPDGVDPAEFIRRTRNEAVAKTDYALAHDVFENLSPVMQDALRTFRQEMRDITDKPGFPWADNICAAPWPINPLTGEKAIAYKLKKATNFDKLVWG